METCLGIEAFQPPAGGITLTIGNFDGVHRGHQRIIATARAVAGQLRTPLVAMTFEPHPLAVLAPGRAPPRLTTADEKLHRLRQCGVDICIVARSEPALLGQSAAQFLTQLRERCRPRAIVEGPDFNFGHGRGGSVDTLREFAGPLGFAVHVAETACCPELPGAPAIRSSAIRTALREGNVGAATTMLGRLYRIVGHVGHGAGRGAPLGFPTANLDAIPHLLPQEAVYATIAQLAAGSFRLAAVNIGPQPTFGQTTCRVEAHLLDWSGPLTDQKLGLHFVARLRRQHCFASAQELVAQLRQDVALTRQHAEALHRLAHAEVAPL